MTAPDDIGIENADPVGKYLRRRSTTAILLVPALIFFLSCILDYFFSLKYPDFLPALGQDASAIAVRLLVPVIVGTYIWIIDGINDLFAGIANSGVFNNKSSYLSGLADFKNSYHSKAMAYSILVISLIFVLGKTLSAYNDGSYFVYYESYLNRFPDYALFRAPFWLSLFYSTSYVVINTVLTIRALHKLVREEDITLWLSHPDGCGGLSSISRFNLRLGIPLASIGVVLAMELVEVFSHTGDPSKSMLLITGVILYFLIAPLLFFLPLSSAHRVMLEEKREELRKMATLHDKLYKESLSSTEKSGKELKDSIAKLQDFNVLYKMVRDFPVWPFDRSSVKKFSAIVSAPILTSILMEIIKSSL